MADPTRDAGRSTRRRVFELLGAARPGDRASRRCDLYLITLISLNVLATIFESVPVVDSALHDFFVAFEQISVGLFTFEYLGRLWSVVEGDDPRFRHPLRGRLRYAVSPIALIDLLAILPFFLSAFFAIDLRFLRVLRILRIFKLSHYFSALDVMLEVVRVERHAFGAAIFLMLIGVLFAASGIYLFEHEVQPEAFGSIPAAMWWAIVTLTTVGYGDVSPITVAGKLFGASITVMGIGMVALPTGILASGFSQELTRRKRIYSAQVDRALEDGFIDAEERSQLEALRNGLGLTVEAVDGMEGRGPHRRGLSAEAVAPEKRPHCGESLAGD